MELLKRIACVAVAIVVAGCNSSSSPPKRELPSAADIEPAKFLFAASDGGSTSRSVVYFLSHYAFESTAPNQPIQVIFDLQDMSWTLLSTGKKTTLAECRVWAEKVSADIRENQAKISDTSAQAFLERALVPQLKAEKKAGTLTIKNEYITYTVRESLRSPQNLMANFFRFDLLNTYRKCMLSEDAPPFAGLEASSLMWQHATLPAQMTMNASQPDGQQVSIGVAIERQPLTNKEKQLLEETLAKAPSGPTDPGPADGATAKDGEG